METAGQTQLGISADVHCFPAIFCELPFYELSLPLVWAFGALL
jgi:hypothetical protein